MDLPEVFSTQFTQFCTVPIAKNQIVAPFFSQNGGRGINGITNEVFFQTKMSVYLIAIHEFDAVIFRGLEYK